MTYLKESLTLIYVLSILICIFVLLSGCTQSVTEQIMSTDTDNYQFDTTYVCADTGDYGVNIKPEQEPVYWDAYLKTYTISGADTIMTLHGIELIYTDLIGWDLYCYSHVDNETYIIYWR